MTSTMTEIASKTLGDSTSYAVYTDQYDSSLLNPMPRKLAREENGIELDFDGYDVWHCYESTFLLDSGHPVSGILKFVYPADTEMMVESKSMKLFLNSFDMCKMGPTLLEAQQNYINAVKDSLIQCLGDERVEANFFRHRDISKNKLEENMLLQGAEWYDAMSRDLVSEDVSSIYNSGHKNYIKLIDNAPGVNHFAFESLRSRCRHTKQKDTGIAIVYTKQNSSQDYRNFDADSIYKQILSLRETNEFHEFCSERIYDNLNTVNKTAETKIDIIVGLLYTRRGSLDINPIRFNKEINPIAREVIIKQYIDVNKLIDASLIQ